MPGGASQLLLARGADPELLKGLAYSRAVHRGFERIQRLFPQWESGS